MRRLFAILGQAIAYLSFAAVVGVFSSYPTYTPTEEGTALIKLSITHPGKRVKECRKRSAKEIQEMPPNMRTQLDCPRERHPVYIRIAVDDTVIFDRPSNPSGLSRDGQSRFYEKFPIAAGKHKIEVGLSEHGAQGAFDFQKTETVALVSREILVIGFDSSKNAIVFK